jgi:hypothetical protein
MFLGGLSTNTERKARKAKTNKVIIIQIKFVENYYITRSFVVIES